MPHGLRVVAAPDTHETRNRGAVTYSVVLDSGGGRYDGRMCGRFSLDAGVDELIREFVADGGKAEDWRPSYSIAPTDHAPIVREFRGEDGDIHRELELGKWDFPKPENSPARGPIFNARIEKLTGGFWAGAFARFRVLVPMNGYYEFTGERGSKQPHFIHAPKRTAAERQTRLDDINATARRKHERQIAEGFLPPDTQFTPVTNINLEPPADNDYRTLAAAGVYLPERVDENTWRPRFVVITREARDASGEIHDRMPAFVEPEYWDEWLNPATLTPADRKAETVAAARGRRDELLDMLNTSSTAVAGTIQTYPVDKKASNTRKLDRADWTLIQPIPV